MTKQDAIDLIKDAGFGFLATTEGDQPRLRPVGPYVTEEGKILIALLSHIRSIPQIKKNPKVEMCFVDRKMSYCRIAGKAIVTNSDESKKTMWDNSPMLRQYFSGPEDPNFSLAEVEITQAEAMSASDQSPQEINWK
ncbi:MAG: pyridoxamine 5'-phosphate oxidase family protein [Candidatus Omnitrophica bacterium]|nr:pyridoxamine 5'-phosphate oxidase family protein [Candidatus Omnitrophota bacterium]